MDLVFVGGMALLWGVMVRPGLREARRAERGPVMISLDVLYGAAGLCAVLLLAYLIYALLRAEEF